MVRSEAVAASTSDAVASTSDAAVITRAVTFSSSDSDSRQLSRM